ncbi:unnamed protein product [Somion occarium]|uniref:ATPase dynein-related AAA domain-containing protein n=1 Tax=Somion occarium TaxID=3059160 RepID=A0ABP1DF12_9APHY
MALGDAIEQDDEDYLSERSVVSSPAQFAYKEEGLEAEVENAEELSPSVMTPPLEVKEMPLDQVSGSPSNLISTSSKSSIAADRGASQEPATDGFPDAVSEPMAGTSVPRETSPQFTHREVDSPSTASFIGSEVASPSSFVATLAHDREPSPEPSEDVPDDPAPGPTHTPPSRDALPKPSMHSRTDAVAVTPVGCAPTTPCTPPTRRQRQRPPSSAPSELSTLLSPIEITLAPPAVDRIGQLEACFHREDSIDSGYADGWTGPSPLALSPPPRSPRRVSTLSLLSSPFRSPSRILSPTFLPSSAAAWPATNLFNPRSQQPEDPPEEPPVDDDDLDSPSDYHLRRLSETCDPPTEQNIEATVKPPSTPPLPDEGFDESLSFDVDAHSTTLVVTEPETTDEHPSNNAQSPTEGNTTLFDSYYAQPSSHDSSVGSSPVVSSPRPSVFSKPRRTTPSSLIIASPRVEQRVAPEAVPLPLSAVGSSRLSAAFSASDVDAKSPGPASSTKVPFGFRHTSLSRNSSRASTRTPDSFTSPRRPVWVETRSSQSSPLEGIIDSRASSRVSSPQRSSSRASRLKPLRLSMILNSSSSALSSLAYSGLPSLTTGTTAPSSALTPSSPTVSSEYSISHNLLLSSSRSQSIPDHDNHTHILRQPRSHLDDAYQTMPHSAPLSRPTSWHRFPDSKRSSRASTPLFTPNNLRPSSRLSERLSVLDERAEVDFAQHDEDDDDYHYQHDEPDVDDTIRGVAVSSAEPIYSRPSSVLRSPIHAIATPRPTLLFAIASDNVDEVRKVLQSGEAGPNDDVGPQSALAFTLTANNLHHKMEIIKLLLAHGANPSTLRDSDNISSSSPAQSGYNNGRVTPALSSVLEKADPATRYYIARAEAPQTRRASALIHRSFFRPLAKVRYDLIGQDRALEQLFRVLSMPTVSPIVVLLCGPSGHGKSLLARKFGSLLDVPTHTVNMTTLRSTHDIWRSYSMNPYEEPSTSTLADFLLENEGKRCVVVLDEIEKTENETYLSSLLMPWELGRCSFEAGKRHVDVSKVIWLGTSNIGHDLVFEHQASRENPEESMSREAYVDLMGILRPGVSQRLGPSLLSRVTTVLPFVPFTRDEKMAIAAEALYALAGEDARSLPSATVEKLVQNSLQEYVPVEGARSLYRAISTQLLDTIY